MHGYMNEKYGQGTYDVTLIRGRAMIVGVEKQ
jgi:hypothetical protein